MSGTARSAQFAISVQEGATSMSDPQDILQPIGRENLTNLLDVLRSQMPLSLVAHNWLTTQLRWEARIPSLRVHVLCPEGDWSSGTVVAYAEGLVRPPRCPRADVTVVCPQALEQRKYGVLYAPEGEQDRRLAEALLRTRAIPWSTLMHFSGVLERHIEMVRAAVEAAGLEVPPMQPIGYLLRCDPEQAKTQKLPQPRLPNIRIGHLTSDHLEEVWGLRNTFTECYKPVIAACLAHNNSLSVLARLGDGSERIASMVMELEHGCVGMGRTHPDYLRHGLQVSLTAALSRILAEEGKVPAGFTWTNNVAILRGGEQIGMIPVARVVRFDISPGKVQGDVGYLDAQGPVKANL